MRYSKVSVYAGIIINTFPISSNSQERELNILSSVKEFVTGKSADSPAKKAETISELNKIQKDYGSSDGPNIINNSVSDYANKPLSNYMKDAELVNNVVRAFASGNDQAYVESLKRLEEGRSKTREDIEEWRNKSPDTSDINKEMAKQTFEKTIEINAPKFVQQFFQSPSNFGGESNQGETGSWDKFMSSGGEIDMSDMLPNDSERENQLIEPKLERNIDEKGTAANPLELSDSDGLQAEERARQQALAEAKAREDAQKAQQQQIYVPPRSSGNCFYCSANPTSQFTY